MKKRTLLAAVIVASTLLTVSAVIYAQAQKEPTIQPASVSVPLNATTIFTLVNAERTQRGIAPLIRDARLDHSAQQKANDMTQNNYFAHISPTTGKHGYEYIPAGMCYKAGENIGLALDMAGDNNKDAVDWWLNSKPHREAMLDPNLSYTGVGVSGPNSVQHFCQIK